MAKKEQLLQVKIDEPYALALRAVAEKKSVTPAELLRRAAYAIIRYDAAGGEVPLDMDIVQQFVARPELLRPLAVAEEQGGYGRGPPSNPTTKKRTHGAGPAQRVSKAV